MTNSFKEDLFAWELSKKGSSSKGRLHSSTAIHCWTVRTAQRWTKVCFVLKTKLALLSISAQFNNVSRKTLVGLLLQLFLLFSSLPETFSVGEFNVKTSLNLLFEIVYLLRGRSQLRCFIFPFLRILVPHQKGNEREPTFFLTACRRKEFYFSTTSISMLQVAIPTAKIVKCTSMRVEISIYWK